jgi:hypothetical protein
MNDERVRRAHEATIAMLDEEIRQIQQQVEARRNIDGVRVDWSHVGQLGGALEYVRDAVRVLSEREG